MIIKRVYLIRLSNLNRYTLFICDYTVNLNFKVSLISFILLDSLHIYIRLLIQNWY